MTYFRYALLAVIGFVTVNRVAAGDTQGAVIGLGCALVGFAIGRSLNR